MTIAPKQAPDPPWLKVVKLVIWPVTLILRLLLMKR